MTDKMPCKYKSGHVTTTMAPSTVSRRTPRRIHSSRRHVCLIACLFVCLFVCLLVLDDSPTLSREEFREQVSKSSSQFTSEKMTSLSLQQRRSRTGRRRVMCVSIGAAVISPRKDERINECMSVVQQ